MPRVPRGARPPLSRCLHLPHFEHRIGSVVRRVGRRQVEAGLGDWGVPDDEQIDRIAAEVGRLSRDQVMAYALHDLWPESPSTPAVAPDEHAVASLLPAGLTNPEIAARLGISVRTVTYRLGLPRRVSRAPPVKPLRNV
jgi:hypothetical protein